MLCIYSTWYLTKWNKSNENQQCWNNKREKHELGKFIYNIEIRFSRENSFKMLLPMPTQLVELNCLPFNQASMTCSRIVCVSSVYEFDRVIWNIGTYKIVLLHV